MISIDPVSAFTDNYIWVIRNDQTKACLIVDPGDASPVIDFVKAHRLQPEAILITHKHADHVGGVERLQQQYRIPTYGPAGEAHKWVDNTVTESTHLTFAKTGISFDIIELPGHTLGHIAYLSPGHLFCGDTLFVAGCGRVFEGTMEQMYRSLRRLAALDDSTKVYCAHEYTLANLNFAKAVEPDNQALQEYMMTAKQLREEDIPTVPSSIQQEKRINPFLRCTEVKVTQAAVEHGMIADANPVNVFATLRQWKDSF